MRKLVLLMAAMPGIACTASGAGAAPRVHRLELAAVGLSVALPANWRTAAREPGWNVVVSRPDGQAKFFVERFREATGMSGFRTLLETDVKKTDRADDPHASFETRAARVASRPAVEIVARYGSLTAFVYGFEYDHDDYILEYVTATTYLAHDRPAFSASVRSVRFLAAPA